MADADCSIEISEGPFDKLVQVNSEQVVVREQGVLCEHCLKAHWLCSHEDNVLEYASALVAVDDVYLFAY